MVRNEAWSHEKCGRKEVLMSSEFGSLGVDGHKHFSVTLELDELEGMKMGMVFLWIAESAIP